MIDLHIHTNASDGTDSTEKLLKKLRSAGIKAFAITDHDTIDGICSMEYWVPDDMDFIRGIEVSCVTEVRNCHILGYGFNKDVRQFGNMVHKAMKKRQEVVERHLDYISEECQIEISKEERFKLLERANSDWKAHLGKMLVSMGKAVDEKQAIDKYIKPCNTDGIRIDAGEAIKAILAAGGIPVWAHPYGGYTKRDMNDADFDKQLHILLEAGLQGIECYYSDFDEAQIESLLAVAKKHNLYISGGSDYHGENKNIALGTLNRYKKVIKEEELTILAELARRQKEKPFPLIEIEEWHNPGACFWFEPVRIKDLSQNTYNLDNQDSMKEAEISISEESFEDFLYPVFQKYFDENMPENKGRYEQYPEGRRYLTGFEWYLTENFYSYKSIDNILKEIEELAHLLAIDYDNDKLDFLRAGLEHLPNYIPRYWRMSEKLSRDEVDEIVRENIGHVVDFYSRFVKSLRSMMEIGKKAGYELISVCGP